MNTFTDSAIQERRRRLAVVFDSLLGSHDVVVIFAGLPVVKPGGLDQTYPFLPHPDYYWISGHRLANGAVLYSKHEGWQDYTHQLSLEDRLWEGLHSRPQGKDIKLLFEDIQAHNYENIYLLGQVPEPVRAHAVDHHSKRAHVQEGLNGVRRIKDQEEIDLVRTTARQAQRGYQLLKKIIQPGITERELQIEFEAEVLRAGAEKFPYDSIIGSGTNSAILHAIPTNKMIQENELVLVDAGADVGDYCVDITRTFSSVGRFTSRQSEIYQLVKAAQAAGIEKCVAGTDWHDVHRTSARVIAEGLCHLQLLQCSVDEALDTGAVSCFFPHGVGHMVGLRVRDVGASLLKEAKTCCGVRVRVDFHLQNGYLMTVEPGIYFVEALLNSNTHREKYKSQVNWAVAEKWLDFGGIRLEDDILVTEKGPENLTALVEK